MRLQREVAGIVEMHFRARNVALESLGAGRDEGWIVLPPNDENGWMRATEILLEFGIERDIAAIIHQQIELNFIIARPRKQGVVECISFRRH